MKNDSSDFAKDSCDSRKSISDSAKDSFDSRDSRESLLAQYDWILVELFDQMIRTKSGGEMLKYLQDLRQFPQSFQHYLISRTQCDFGDSSHSCDSSQSDSRDSRQNQKIRLIDKLTKDKILNKILALYLRAIRAMIPPSLRDEIFINTAIGERHKWAYDSFSLARLLEQCGFCEISRLDFATSNIPQFSAFCLDNNADGSAYKGASLYMECKK